MAASLGLISAIKLLLKYPNLYYSTSAFAPKHYPKAIIEYANKRGDGQDHVCRIFPEWAKSGPDIFGTAQRPLCRCRLAQVPLRKRRAGFWSLTAWKIPQARSQSSPVVLRGIGLSIVLHLLAEGWHVATCGRTPPGQAIKINSREARFHTTDVRNPVQAKSLIEETVLEFGRLDLVVNNAGGSPAADAATASPRFSEAIIALNLLAPLHVSQAAYPHLRATGGNIIKTIRQRIAVVAASPGTAADGCRQSRVAESLTRQPRAGMGLASPRSYAISSEGRMQTAEAT
jgi:hypothetical protein